jgi:membrane protease subunit HflK
MYLEAMQQIFANTTKIMIDTRSGNNLIYLPLDKLIAQTGAVEAGAARPNPAAAAAAQASDGQQASEAQPQRESRARESRDSRQREAR